MNIRPINPCFTERPTQRNKTPSTPFIDRRHFLRGLGMALALPAFESLNVGFAATAPRADPRRLLCIGNHLGFWPEGFFPTTDGREFTLSKTLAPLQAYRKDFTVFCHLDHDTKGGHGAVHSFLTDVKKEESAGFPENSQKMGSGCGVWGQGQFSAERGIRGARPRSHLSADFVQVAERYEPEWGM